MTMTVSEMIAFLEKFPGDLPVEILGYVAGSDTDDLAYTPALVDGWQNEAGEKGVTIWATRNPPVADEEGEAAEPAMPEVGDAIAFMGEGGVPELETTIAEVVLEGPSPEPGEPFDPYVVVADAAPDERWSITTMEWNDAEGRWEIE